MHLVLVPPTAEFFDPIWPIVSGLLSGACERSLGMHTLDSTLYRIKKSMCQLWVVINDDQKIADCCTSSFIDFPSGRKALMMELMSRPVFWISCTDHIEKWAKENGGDEMIIPVSRHMRKEFVSKRSGYRPGRYLMVKELADVSAA